ncbi:MAG: suppressor of fused domain protein [Leadbetterella sp.]|nr:suppressor of fused domain protein [Leadbetterella sp.]
MNNQMNDLITHLESEFGEIKHGWDRFPEGGKWPFQVISLENGRYNGISTFSTLGLSNYLLNSPVSSKIIQQELFLMVPNRYGYKNIPSLLNEIGSFAIDNKKAFLRGDIVDFNSGLSMISTNFTAFYVSMPVYFPDSFASFTSDINKNNIVICWLIPIFEEEKNFIRNNGWGKFEEIIENVNPDFFDLNREILLVGD